MGDSENTIDSQELEPEDPYSYSENELASLAGVTIDKETRRLIISPECRDLVQVIFEECSDISEQTIGNPVEATVENVIFDPTTSGPCYEVEVVTEHTNVNTEEILTSVVNCVALQAAVSDDTTTPLGDAYVFHGSPGSLKKRSRRPDKKKWSREIQKNNRMNGKEYFGFRTEVSNGEKKKHVVQQLTKCPRQIQSTCRSKVCEKSKLRHCEKFTESDRTKLFDNFWTKMDWGQKRGYVGSLIDKIPRKGSIQSPKSRRSETFVYWLKLGDEKKQVCRNMFMATLGIGRNMIHWWLKGGKAAKVSVARPQLQENPGTTFLKTFLSELPKLPSHYCRKSSTKLYLEPVFKSLNHLYKIYSTNCGEMSQKAMPRWKFSKCVEEMNISLFQTKKDQCDTCVAHEVGNVPDEEWKSHILTKNRAREEKTADKADGANGLCHVLTMDVESVKVGPFLKASALYYKTKLVVHNFTVYDLNSHRTCCYWWDKTESELVASTFATCIVDYLENNYLDNLPIIIYSDGCTNQNRNAMMSNALLNHAVEKNKIIFQKFLEKGHTQMECDSVHSAIETRLKNKVIYLPSDYADICRDARRSPEPYQVKFVGHDFFNDYSDKENQRYISIRPGNKKGDPCVTNIRLIKYEPSGIISYKLKYDDNWEVLPRASNNISFSKSNLYSRRLSVPVKKYNDLQDLKHVIPCQFHQYYDEIPHK